MSTAIDESAPRSPQSVSPTTAATLPPRAWFSQRRPAHIQPRRHATFDGEARSQLAADGYCVIAAALNHAECARALELAWDYVEAASAAQAALEGHVVTASGLPAQCAVVERDCAETWTAWPACVEGGILPYFGAGHSQCSWFVRTVPRVRAIFEALWGTPDLISSFDGLLLWRPWTPLDRAHRTESGWFHIDQNPRHKPNFAAVQAFVSLLPSSARTGGNVLIAGSHHSFPHHYSESPMYADRLDEVGLDDWVEVDPADTVLVGADRPVLCCRLEAGDMLIWDSRVVHCSCPGALPEDADYNDESQSADSVAAAAESCAAIAAAARGLVRACVLVTMMPRARASDETARQRGDAVRRAQTLTHWADKAASLGAERDADLAAREMARVQHMRTHSPHALVDPDALTAEQRALI
jgi:hypothetical protein